jgi:hypothetical protein
MNVNVSDTPFENIDGSIKTKITVGVVGGGVAGSTVALRLAELGIPVTLIEEGATLVNGPPICHLHAGGNLYREISDEQCVTLLRQSIDTLRVFPHTVNIRPTVIAVPLRDSGNPDTLLPRLKLLKKVYKKLIEQDEGNAVLGDPDEYFKVYQQQDLINLAAKSLPLMPVLLDDWMIPVAKNLNLNTFKYPIIMVQEYGLSIFRIAATASLAFDKLPACKIYTNAKVTKIEKSDCENQQTWNISFQRFNDPLNDHQTESITVDYLVNACGYRTGSLDDMANIKRNRMVEFKAAYVTQWPTCKGVWPEVIFHGERGTPNGMAQLTPYPDGYFQLHGMTEDITLFKKGLVSSTKQSAQPKLEEHFINKLKTQWKPFEVVARTQRAINHMAQFVPKFDDAIMGGNPLFGAQQIPGNDPTLRAADVSFEDQRYARSEIVKASSAISAADAILDKLVEEGLITKDIFAGLLLREEQFQVTHALNTADVVRVAEQLAESRHFPKALAQPVNITKNQK